MKTRTKFASMIVFLLLASPVLLLQSCGSPVAEDQGCPKGTYLANATDTITAPGAVTFTGESSVGNRYPGGTVLETPVTFKVTDVAGPRNNICLLAYTGDTASGIGPYWYTDATYGTYIIGTGPYSARAIVTNDAGVATVYWSTADLPVGLPRVVSSVSGTTITYEAGKDQKGTSFIHVYSGSKDATFNVNWTVQGEPAK